MLATGEQNFYPVDERNLLIDFSCVKVEREVLWFGDDYAVRT